MSDVYNHVMQNLSVDLSVNQLYRSKRKAKDLIDGDEQLQYGVLRDYAQMINTVDKGSRVIVYGSCYCGMVVMVCTGH